MHLHFQLPPAADGGSGGRIFCLFCLFCPKLPPTPPLPRVVPNWGKLGSDGESLEAIPTPGLGENPAHPDSGGATNPPKFQLRLNLSRPSPPSVCTKSGENRQIPISRCPGLPKPPFSTPKRRRARPQGARFVPKPSGSSSRDSKFPVFPSASTDRSHGCSLKIPLFFWGERGRGITALPALKSHPQLRLKSWIFREKTPNLACGR